MIRKLLCWLGWHDWWSKRFFENDEWITWCKHCGKVKK
jgi:hypothetical protein